MKKIFFLFAMVLAASFTIAQNTAEVTEVGDFNSATVNQIGVNEATVNQYSKSVNAGEGNLVTVTQTSTSLKNVATVNQGSASSLIKEATGIVDQQSEDNIATLNQGTNLSTSGTWGKITQKVGGSNEATINQIRYTHGRGDKWGKITDNEAEVYQEGINNDAVITTEVAGGKSLISQIGNDNSGTILSDGERTFQAYIVQEGSNNIADIDQFGDANIVGDIHQIGIGNEAYLKQKGSRSTTYIVQDGNDNDVNLSQTGGGNADIYQEGNLNVVMGLDADPVATSFNGSTLDVDQFGTGNTLHLQQTNGASATVFQDGITNTSVIIQN